MHSGEPARRSRPARRMRQDGSRAAHGCRECRRAGDHDHRRAVRARVVPWARARGRHRSLALRRRAPCGTDVTGGVRRARGGHAAVIRPLQRDGHRLDADKPGRSAGDVPSRNGVDPGGRCGAAPRRRGDRPACRRAGARAPEALAGPHRRCVRQRDHRAGGDRRLHECRHPPARPRRPGRRGADPRSLRRDLAPHAGPCELAAVRRVLGRALPSRGRRASAAQGARASAERRGADCHRAYAGRRLRLGAGSRP